MNLVLKPFVALFLITMVVGGGSAQAKRFNEIGRIRTVVSETRSPHPAWLGPRFNGKLSGEATSKIDFFFVYTLRQDGIISEKWLRLPNDRNWNSYPNRVQISGDVDDDRLSSVTVSSHGPSDHWAPIGVPPTTGLYKAIAVALTIEPQRPSDSQTNARALTITPEQIRYNFAGAPDSVNNFYSEASMRMLSFTGIHDPQIDVVPMTIEATISGDCQQQIISEFTPIIQQRLLDHGINTMDGSVDLGLIFFNDTVGCPPYPFATVGPLGARGVPFWMWMPENWFVTGPRILTHEIGHALGGNHPLTARCTDFNDPQTCTYTEAVDRNFMSSGGTHYMLPSNFERRRWGWHPAGALTEPFIGSRPLFDLRSSVVPFVKEGMKQGKYYFQNMQGAYAGWQIYPEGRQNSGIFEQYLGTDKAFASGLTVRYGHSNYTDPNGFSILLDPNSTPTNDDSPLHAGEELSIGGLTIGCRREQIASLGTRMSLAEAD